MSDAVAVESLHKTFSSPDGSFLTVLDGVSFAAAAGQVTALVGASGSGKSTLLSICGLLQQPDAGTVSFGGRRADTMSDRQRTLVRRHEIGFVFQVSNLIPQLTAVENVCLPMLASQRRADLGLGLRLLESVGLRERSGHLPGQLSGGEAQRVATCRALANKPRILLADEPTGSLDRESADTLRSLLRSVAQDGVAVIIATHDPLTVGWADTVVGLSHGRVQRIENPVRSALVSTRKAGPV